MGLQRDSTVELQQTPPVVAGYLFFPINRDKYEYCCKDTKQVRMCLLLVPNFKAVWFHKCA